MIDLHSHLLPGIDDGCRTLEESISCVRRCWIMDSPAPFAHLTSGRLYTLITLLERIVEWVTLLQGHLDAAGLNYQLWTGGEVRIANDTISWLEKHGVPTIGSSRHVLVDYWGNHWPAYADQVIEHLLETGYQPVLAHPERMDFGEADWDAVLVRLQQQGVCLQGNLKCLAGHEGSKVAQRALRLLKEDRYHLVATDMHGAPDLSDRLAGLSVVEQHVGSDKLRELLEAAPREIVAPSG